MKKILVDVLPFEVDRNIIKESLEQKRPLIVTGVVQRAGVKNQNGRIYPLPILQREAKRYAENEIREKRALGELDHPDSTIVNLANVSHNVLELNWRGNDLVGKIEILRTPAGNILTELLSAGIRLGISSRGMGSVKNIDEQTVEVDDDFSLVCFDFVSNPSTQGAFMEAKLNESKIITIDKYYKLNKIITDILTTKV
jgi:hypothetical protein